MNTDEIRGPYGQQALPPDWVMLGVPMADGSVMLLASKELTSSELECERPKEDLAYFLDGYRPLPEMRYHVRADMKTFVLIQAPDYEKAFTHLFAQWRPERAKRAALDAPRRALPEGKL